MTPEQAKALRAPFPKESIGRLPKGGTFLDFVGHAACTDRLLAVDESWWWEPLALDEDGLPAYDKSGGLWIKLHVAETTTLGYGDGPTVKERIGDAIRNAAMRRGVALDLWAKEDLSAIHADPTPVVETDAATLAELEDEFAKVETLTQLQHASNAVEAAVNMGLLSSVDVDVLKVAYRKAAATLKPEPEALPL